MASLPIISETQSESLISSNLCNFNFPINPNFNVKLDDTNYLIWKEQLKHVITVYSLQSFIDGSAVPPPKIIKKIVKIVDQSTNETRVEEMFEENPDYGIWERKDSAVKNWIYSSLTCNYLKHLVGKSTAYEYWLALQKAFTDDSQARLMQLRWQLQTMRKGGLTMEAYISAARELINHVIAAGDVISPREQVLYVLGGLDLNYTSLVTNITNKKHIPSLDEVFSRMRTYEQQLQRMHMPDPMLIQANLAKQSDISCAYSNNFTNPTQFSFNPYTDNNTPFSALLSNTTPNSTVFTQPNHNYLSSPYYSQASNQYPPHQNYFTASNQYPPHQNYFTQRPNGPTQTYIPNRPPFIPSQTGTPPNPMTNQTPTASFAPSTRPLSSPNHTWPPPPQPPNTWPIESKTQCQICKKFGHTAAKCYFRYMSSKNGPQPPNPHPPSYNQALPRNPQAHFTDVQSASQTPLVHPSQYPTPPPYFPIHQTPLFGSDFVSPVTFSSSLPISESSLTPPISTPSAQFQPIVFEPPVFGTIPPLPTSAPLNPFAMYANSSPTLGTVPTQSTQSTSTTEVVAQLGTISDSAWYLDTGASHHLTSNATHLDNAQPYTGQDQVMLGFINGDINLGGRN